MNRRIFYTNVTHCCNNHCKYCFDKLAYIGESKDMSLSQICNIIDDYKVTENDRFIINGGEPTLHSQLNQIIDIISKTGCEIVMYSNGRNFGFGDFSRFEYFNKINRITVPLHGDKDVHNFICQREMGFLETVNGIKNVIMYLSSEIEIKLIVNYEVVKNNIDFVKVLCINGFTPNKISGLVITKVVSCEVSDKNYKKNKDLFLINYMDYINNLINEAIRCGYKKIKILDVPICKLDANIKSKLRNIPVIDEFSEFWVFDNNHFGRSIDYKIPFCLIDEKHCNQFPQCSSILKSYYVLTCDSENNKWYYGLE